MRPSWSSQTSCAGGRWCVTTRTSPSDARPSSGSSREDGSEISWHVPWWWVDAGKAMMLLLLAAIDEGLGAGVFGLFPAENNEQLGDLLGLPEDVTVVGVVTIGHAAPETAQGSRKFGW